MNIVSLVMNFLSPALIGKIASALGIESKLAQMAISAALPAILSGIIGKSATPSGLGQLTDLLGKQDPGFLSGFANMLGGAKQQDAVSQGGNLLSSLLGGSTTAALAGALGKFAGIGETQSKGLMGMLAPVVMGTLAHQQRSNNLDAGGLASMLAGQKDNVAAALPSGFGDLLKGTGLLDSVMPSAGGALRGAASAAAGAATGAARSSAATAQSTAHAGADAMRGAAQSLPRAPDSSWLKWAALLAALLAGWYLLGPARHVSAPTARIVYNNVDVAGQMNGAFDTMKSVLPGIRDADSARAALPRLQQAAGQINTMRDLGPKMPVEQRSDLAKLAAYILPVLRPLIGTALGAAGVSGIAKPILDQVLGALEGMAKG